MDELNLAEFPIASVSDRFLDGKKTVIFDDQVFDRKLNRMVPRQLTVSGSDRYGLPTAKDDDVLLACIQLSRLSGFRSPDVEFSRYELLKLLGWSDNSRNYARISESLRRWKGVSIYSDRAFYDKAQESWVNRDFGVIDTLYIYQREVSQGAKAASCSRFSWNEVLFQSFQSGYLKQLDWGLYKKLQSPVAKRLYRFLDKRFYHRSFVEMDLRELAISKIRLSESYNVAQMKRALDKGIAELEELWALKRVPSKSRYKKSGAGEWTVRIERKRHSKAKELQQLGAEVSRPAQGTNLVKLTKRGVGPATADELCQLADSTSIQTMIELYDWYNQRGQSRGPGFLVQSIKNPNRIEFPPGFESRAQVDAKREAEESRIEARREFQSKREAEHATEEKLRTEAFNSAWERLSTSEQRSFENEALGSALSFKRSRYMDERKSGGRLFDHYRQMILIDHFQKLTAVEHARWFGAELELKQVRRPN